MSYAAEYGSRRRTPGEGDETLQGPQVCPPARPRGNPQLSLGDRGVKLPRVLVLLVIAGFYTRYAHDMKEAALRRRLPVWRAETALTNLALDAGPAYANTQSLCRPPLRRQLLAGNVARDLNGHPPERAVLDAHALAPTGDALGGMIAADVATALPAGRLPGQGGPGEHGPRRRGAAAAARSRAAGAGRPHPVALQGPPRRDEMGAQPGVRRHAAGRPAAAAEAGLRDAPRRLAVRLAPRRLRGSGAAPGAWVGGAINQPLAARLFRDHLAGIGRHGGGLWSLLVLARWGERYLAATGAQACRR